MKGTFSTDVKKGLEAFPKTLPSKYFYDARGDALFVKIMQLPEYYLTSCEMEIFTKQIDALVNAIMTHNTSFELIELGAGDGTKTMELLKKMNGVDFTYSPVDISGNALRKLVVKLNSVLPGLHVKPRQGEYFQVLETIQSALKKIILFLGSNIGNLNDDEARSFICTLASKMNKGDLFLLGVDLKKDESIILPAYSDSMGITSDFNLNLLVRINAELGGNFVLNNFIHAPVYDARAGVAISYIQSTCDQEVYIESLDLSVGFERGEKIHTEISRKYDMDVVRYIIRGSGLEIKELFYDRRKYFCDVLFEKKV